MIVRLQAICSYSLAQLSAFADYSWRSRRTGRKMRKMRHKNWKTYLKIACSWLLIFSICFMNLETVSASEDETSVVTEQEETQDTEAFTSETDAQQTENQQTSEQFTSQTETETSA